MSKFNFNESWVATRSIMFPNTSYFVKEANKGNIIFLVKDLTDMGSGYEGTAATDERSEDILKINNYTTNFKTNKLSEVFCWMNDLENVLEISNEGGGMEVI